ncbi:hypothetical protein B0H17DRAFT_1142140 [Mycena rosella]|uniref:Uncharacterized protein n=1 Tax=Mycena rosella TaxID=1033263 RepID=A0AAD7CXY7_MYCRO|nr:hypothetical protein B0H17DRAFT_1142140 [Mycena rosella]
MVDLHKITEPKLLDKLYVTPLAGYIFVGVHNSSSLYSVQDVTSGALRALTKKSAENAAQVATTMHTGSAVNGRVWTASLPPVTARLFFEADAKTARAGVPLTGPVPPERGVEGKTVYQEGRAPRNQRRRRYILAAVVPFNDVDRGFDEGSLKHPPWQLEWFKPELESQVDPSNCLRPRNKIQLTVRVTVRSVPPIALRSWLWPSAYHRTVKHRSSPQNGTMDWAVCTLSSQYRSSSRRAVLKFDLDGADKDNAKLAWFKQLRIFQKFELDLQQLLTILEPFARAVQCPEGLELNVGDVWKFYVAITVVEHDLFKEDTISFPPAVRDEVCSIVNQRFDSMINGPREDRYFSGFYLDSGTSTSFKLRRRPYHQVSGTTTSATSAKCCATIPMNYFENVALPVNVFHFKSKHRASANWIFCFGLGKTWHT